MLNAKALILCCATASIAVYAKLLSPELELLEAAQAAHGRSTMDYDRAVRQLDQILPVPTMALPRRDLTITSLALMSRWSHTSRDYGVTLTDVQIKADLNGQSVQNIRAYQTSLGPSGVQVVRIKGSYQSLEEWVEFVREQMIYQYVSVGQLKMQGRNFEMVVQIFGEPSP
jgi:hypothetical protein